MSGKSQPPKATTGAKLMKLKWTTKTLTDLVRLHEFLLPLNKVSAAATQFCFNKFDCPHFLQKPAHYSVPS